MSEKKKLVPKRRFKEFENADPWEQRKIGEITESYSGGTPSITRKEYYSGTIPFIRSAEINKRKTELFLSENGINNSSAKLVRVGDILYALYGATSGEVGISQINGAINQAVLAIIPYKSYDTQFLMQWLRKRKQEIIKKYLQGGQGNLSGSLVKNLIIKLPNSDEQIKIGSILKIIDNLITLHQRKLEKLKNLKSAYLSEMFPAEGERKPKRRFAGFTDDWEQRKLGEVARIIMGQSPEGNTYSETASDFILVQGNADMQNGWVIPRVWTSQVTKKAAAGDLIMSVRAPAGSMGKTAFNVVIGRGVAAIKGNEFLYQLLVNLDSNGYWKTISTGSTFESLSSGDIIFFYQIVF